VSSLLIAKFLVLTLEDDVVRHIRMDECSYVGDECRLTFVWTPLLASRYR
jgi:hypothetical protein